jgi:hypothetical protein
MEIDLENCFASAMKIKWALNKALAIIKRREREMDKKLEEVRQTRLVAEQKRVEQEWLEPDFARFKQKQSSIDASRDSQPTLIERQLQEPEIQQLNAEQERLRIEAEQLWLEQERHFAEQVRLRIETESTDRHQYEAESQPLIPQQRTFESEKQLSEKETYKEIESKATTQFSDDLIQSPLVVETFLESPKQSVSSDILSAETANLPFTSPKNHKISWGLPIATLIFLLLGGAVLGVWFLQPSKIKESSQTNSSKIESSQKVSLGGVISNLAPDAKSSPKIKEVSPPTLPVKPVVREVSKPLIKSQPVTPQMKKQMPQSLKSRKLPSKPKRPVTIDDILNDQ